MFNALLFAISDKLMVQNNNHRIIIPETYLIITTV